MDGLLKKPTQCDKVLGALVSAKGDWVKGSYFLRELYLSQYHARIYELQQKGWEIESGPKDEHGFVSYRLLPKETLW